MDQMLRSEVDVAFFDAVGTLIHPEPAAAVVYAEVGRRFGSRLTAAEVAPRFAAAFLRQEEQDRRIGFKTSETRERERWQDIVGEVLDDVSEAVACFQELFEHFSRPRSWHCDPDAALTMGRLAEEGLTLGLASNYDSRLRRVVAGLAPLRIMRHLAISSEIGWRKPAPAFFASLCSMTGKSPERILFIGDDRINDYQGARAAGLKALLFDPEEKEPALADMRITRLRDVLSLIR